MSTIPQLRMHAGASDTHIPRPLLSRAADEIDTLAAHNRELVAAVEAALDYCSSEAIGTVQQEIEDNARMQQTLRAVLNYGR